MVYKKKRSKFNSKYFKHFKKKLMRAQRFSSLAIQLSNKGFLSKFKFARNFMLRWLKTVFIKWKIHELDWYFWTVISC